MFLDIFIAALVLTSMIIGYRIGLVHSLLKMTGWIIALVAAVFLHPIVYALLRNKLGVHSLLVKHINKMIDNGLDVETFGENFPEILQDGFEKLANSATDIWAIGISNLLLNIICLLIVTFLIKGLFHLIYSIIAVASDDENVIGFIDSLFGMIFGFIKAYIVVCLLLALLLPVTTLVSPKLTAPIKNQMATSIVSSALYDNNLAMVIFKDFANDTK